MGYSPWGRKESDMTEATEHTRKAELKESVPLPHCTEVQTRA